MSTPVQIGTLVINGNLRPIWRRETKPARYSGRCGGCKRRLSALMLATIDTGRDYYAEGETAAHPLVNGTVRIVCCDRERELLPVRGTFNASKKCSARCTGATGHDCDCHCAGRNHGADHNC